MNIDSTFWYCILISVIGITVIVGIIWFGYSIFIIQSRKNPDGIFLEKFIYRIFENSPSRYDDIPRIAAESYSEYLQRRNEFWTAYGQVLIAVLIVIVLSILLLTKAISAEAGLPILSGVSGFAIAKGVTGTKTMSMPQDRNRG